VVALGKLLPSGREFLSILLTFSLTVFAWIFFRADNITHAFSYIKGIFTSSLLSVPTILPFSLFGLLAFFMTIEWMGRGEQYAIEAIGARWKRPVRWGFYYVIIFLIFFFMGKEQEFIYFQF
jgi:ABC-type phosphate transport system permease subunit